MGDRRCTGAVCPVGDTQLQVMQLSVWRDGLFLVRYLHEEAGCGLRRLWWLMRWRPNAIPC